MRVAFGKEGPNYYAKAVVLAVRVYGLVHHIVAVLLHAVQSRFGNLFNSGVDLLLNRLMAVQTLDRHLVASSFCEMEKTNISSSSSEAYMAKVTEESDIR